MLRPLTAGPPGAPRAPGAEPRHSAADPHLLLVWGMEVIYFLICLLFKDSWLPSCAGYIHFGLQQRFDICITSCCEAPATPADVCHGVNPPLYCWLWSPPLPTRPPIVCLLHLTRFRQSRRSQTWTREEDAQGGEGAVAPSPSCPQITRGSPRACLPGLT